MEIWVKVITANPLKGPCEGQVQFLVEWERRKAVHRDWVWFSYGGKRHKSSMGSGYATVFKNFEFDLKAEIVRIERPDLYLAITIIGNIGWMEAITARPPQFRQFRSYVANSNADRWGEDTRIHWDAGKLCEELIGKVFEPYWAKKARFEGVQGDESNAFVSVYPGDDCITLYVEDDGPAPAEKWPFRIR